LAVALVIGLTVGLIIGTGLFLGTSPSPAEAALLEKFTWLVTEKARDGKYPHSTGKFTDTMRVKDQIEYFYFYFSSFFFQNTMELDWI
jgi:hypothetical protein